MSTAFDFSFAFSSTPLAPMDFVFIVLIAAAVLLWLTADEDEPLPPLRCSCGQIPQKCVQPTCAWRALRSCSLRRMFRFKLRRHRRSADGEPAWSFGLRFGYWPCLKAPFVECTFLFWKVQVWHGYADREMFARGDA